MNRTDLDVTRINQELVNAGKEVAVDLISSKGVDYSR
jgi:hypothetical protein